MSKTIRITLDLTVEPFPHDELLEFGFEGDDSEPDEISAGDACTVAEGVAAHISCEDYAEELLAGSMCFVKIKGAKAISAAVLEGGAA